MSNLTRQFEMNLLKHMFARTVADKLWICHPWCWPNQDVQWIRTVTGNQKNVVWNATAIIAKWLIFPNSSMYNLTLHPAITKVHCVHVIVEFLLRTHVGLSFGGFAGSFLSGSGWLTTKWLTKPMMRRQKKTPQNCTRSKRWGVTGNHKKNHSDPHRLGVQKTPLRITKNSQKESRCFPQKRDDSRSQNPNHPGYFGCFDHQLSTNFREGCEHS